MRLSGGSEPQPRQAGGHQDEQLVPDSLQCAVSPAFFFLDIVLFSYPIISTKCSSVFLASGDKKKAITLEIKLKITALTVG